MKKAYKISELSTLLKRGITPSYTDELKVMVINQKCIRDYKLNLDLARYTDPEKKKIADEKYLKSYDVLVNSTGVGTLGRVAQISEVNRPVTSDSHVTIVRPDDQTIDPLYFGYCLKSRQKHIEALGEGSTGQTELSRVLLGDMEIEILEDFREQKAVANFFKAIDDKIELNQQMNEILEDIAKTLFKSWFIDFDPVRAKAEGRPTGLSKQISDLFPDSFEDSELGVIPTGWNYRSIYEDLNVIYGAPFSSKMFNSDSKGIQVIRIRDLKEQKSDIYTEEVHPKGVLIEKGDVVVGMDGEFRPYLWSGENAWMNQRICKFVPKHHLSSTFIIETLRKQLRFIELTEVATTVIHLGKSDIDEFLILNEGGGVIKIFNQICKPIEEKIISNNSESRKLEEIRDILLPKLISGELQITDAENLVEEAGI